MLLKPNGKCQDEIEKYIYVMIDVMIETLLPEDLMLEYKDKN
jgi:hypothetical protein